MREGEKWRTAAHLEGDDCSAKMGKGQKSDQKKAQSLLSTPKKRAHIFIKMSISDLLGPAEAFHDVFGIGQVRGGKGSELGRKKVEFAEQKVLKRTPDKVMPVKERQTRLRVFAVGS